MIRVTAIIFRRAKDSADEPGLLVEPEDQSAPPVILDAQCCVLQTPPAEVERTPREWSVNVAHCHKEHRDNKNRLRDHFASKAASGSE